MKGHLKTSALLVAVIGFGAALLGAAPAAAQVSYSYVGNPFTLFSCGPSSSGSGTLNCPTPAPANPNTTYTAVDHVEVTITLDSALPANMTLQDIRSLPGFSMTMDDGQHTVTNLQAVGMFAEVATGTNGEILEWHLVINTGGTLNGGIATSKYTFVSDGGTISCCDPTVPGNFGRLFSNPGTWTVDTGTVTPQDAVASLINVVNDPATRLTAGQASSLTDKLQQAIASIDAGLNKQAINQLKAFVNSVESSAKNGKIGASTAATLIAAANDIIGML